MKQKRITWDIILSHFTSVKSKNQERGRGGGRGGSVVQCRCLIKKRRRGVMEAGDDGACFVGDLTLSSRIVPSDKLTNRAAN